MKETGLIFQSWGVRAIIAGTKTQTRRTRGLESLNCNPGLWSDPQVGHDPRFWIFSGEHGRRMVRCPYGVPGDFIYIKEGFSTCALGVYPCPQAWYRADFDQFDDPAKNLEHTCPPEYQDRLSQKYANFADCFACVREREGPFRWQSSMYMPRRLARYVRELTEVRVQRVQEISEEDARAEGVEAPVVGESSGYRGRYAIEWNRLNAKRGHGWDVNDWVWALTFGRMSPA